MKRNIVYMLFAFALTQCTDPTAEKIFDKGYNERIEAQRQIYMEALTAPKQGWVGEYAISHGDYLDELSRSGTSRLGAFTCLLKFTSEGRVIVKSDYKKGAADAIIGYRIDQGWKMQLVFENHTLFHDIAEREDFLVRGGFVFNIQLEEPSGNVTLSSVPNRRIDGFEVARTDLTYLRLRPAKAHDWNLKAIYAIENLLKRGRNPKSIGVRGEITVGQGTPPIAFRYSPESRVMVITPDPSSKIDAPIRVTATGIGFVPPIRLNNVELSNFRYDINQQLFVDAKKNTIQLDDP